MPPVPYPVVCAMAGNAMAERAAINARRFIVAVS
jgi:hypothetical protein